MGQHSLQHHQGQQNHPETHSYSYHQQFPPKWHLSDSIKNSERDTHL